MTITPVYQITSSSLWAPGNYNITVNDTASVDNAKKIIDATTQGSVNFHSLSGELNTFRDASSANANFIAIRAKDTDVPVNINNVTVGANDTAIVAALNDINSKTTGDVSITITGPANRLSVLNSSDKGNYNITVNTVANVTQAKSIYNIL